MASSSKIWHVYWSVVIATGIVVGTGLIPNFGSWYSSSLPLRRQTEALLHGHVAVSFSAASVEHDMVWINGGVQEVWGLGVPIWRSIFELIAKLSGQSAFPDRIAIVVAWALLVFVLLRTFLVPERGEESHAGFLKNHPERLSVVLLLASFPPILTLCRGPFQVYEEVVLYGYLYAVGLFTALLTFVQRPGLGLYLLLGALSGFAGFIRPTIMCYALATVALAFAYGRRIGWTWTKSSSALGLFGLGAAILFCSNHERFGSGFEFGHNLNLMYPDMIYTSRFHATFQHEPFWASARELFGSLFWVKNISDTDPYASGIVAFQSTTPRWRQFYESTFDLSYFAFVLLSWAIALVLTANYLKRRSKVRDSEVMLCALWSLMGILPLSLFYLRFQAIACRYMMDFAPGIAAAMASILIAFSNVRRWPLLLRWVTTGAFVAWWGCEMFTAKVGDHLSSTTKTEVLRRMSSDSQAANQIPREYLAADSPAGITGIRENGKGWYAPEGSTGPVVVLFVQEPSKMVLQVCPADTDAQNSDEGCSEIQAKVGLEFLKLDKVTKSNGIWFLTFLGPTKAAYRRGTQVVFLSFATPGNFMDKESRFRLLEVKSVLESATASD